MVLPHGRQWILNWTEHTGEAAVEQRSVSSETAPATSAGRKDPIKPGKAVVKGWLQKVSAGPWLLPEKKIIDCQTEGSGRSRWVNPSLLEQTLLCVR